MSDAVVDLGFAKVDVDRISRCGHPEVIFGENKSPEEFAAVACTLFKRTGSFLATRCRSDHYSALRDVLPEATYHARARCITAGESQIRRRGPLIGVVCAGTSDLPVALECEISLRMFGRTPRLFSDVGVAGIHRLFGVLEDLRACGALIVIAGMEGALPSVVAGLVKCPVIAVPTSVGYGSAFGGLAALLGMLNSCAAGLVVTNIDNGFGAAAAVHRIFSGVDGNAATPTS